jgi:hypothetical protein
MKHPNHNIADRYKAYWRNEPIVIPKENITININTDIMNKELEGIRLETCRKFSGDYSRSRLT